MERRVIAISGTVQGVGFRPFVYRVACGLALTGFVRNGMGTLHIEVEGDAASLDRFLEELLRDKPPLARVHELTWRRIPFTGELRFRIEESDASGGRNIVIAPDIATCAECLAELFDAHNRRYLYPFINCTNCGPRLSIVTGAPYDRAATTMCGFPTCAACRAEYEDPLDRRFHAQPVACETCGPGVSLLNGRGQVIRSLDPIGDFAAALRAGKIGAIKGIGGYHLACDAGCEEAVGELRRRKHRDEKPFAVMVRDIQSVHGFCRINETEIAALVSPRRPIVLLQKLASPTLLMADGIAPGNPALGVMLPYTPLHHLLLKAVEAAPLVMTSGNQSNEPIAFEDADALARLARVADIFLTHNRRIHIPCDDSVIRIVNTEPSPVRRSRGYAPEPLPLPIPSPVPLLALGGQQKSTFALAASTHGILSHHLGDLDHLAAANSFESMIDLYQRLFSIEPAYLVHDLHPDYASTRYADRRSKTSAVKRMAVQHHHAHMASCMAEHGLKERVIGVCFDGTGLGADGAIWGGEFLVGGYRSFIRAAHLRYVGLPGGEAAVKEPWRMAAAYLRDAGADFPGWEQAVPPGGLRTVHRMLERKFNTPLTSSVGRLFDAVASLTGTAQRVSYEGQAAIQLEALATGTPPEGCYSFKLAEDSAANSGNSSRVVDLRPMIREIARDGGNGMNPQRIARRFHSTLVEIIVTTCERVGSIYSIEAVVLSGGVFMNAVLSTEAAQRLIAAGFRVYQQRIVPSNDGGLALGQLAIAAATLTPAT